MNQTIRIIVADDHSSIRAGVSRLLDSVAHMSVVGVAADTLALAKLLDTCPCDLVVSDIGMPGIDGESNAILFLRRMLRFVPHVPIVILTMIHQPRTLAGLLHMGVAAIVDKRDATASLVSAIDAAYTGRLFLSKRALEAIGDAAARQPGAAVLSAREWEVFRMYTQGMTIQQIAERLARSGKTISTQKRNAMRKLGLDSESSLIAYARQIGLT
ncbi:response regulator transcription factor [Paraburkholderia rhizosphaerae]|uniref:LuxR family two component transcriptional regulator n=1 Tax=Paraburkholderia rhizosphaerae TaxID=480658 RepID=A0A4R8M0M0_9BURK|nr:response regulator transcription factor [Paraburkholderia rhizosphaerae]TDY53406.1 LuxR family two component transcriptional regulator [Paraburkholderia rhizosphaerae]